MLIAAVGLSSAIVYFEFAFSRNIKPTQASPANNVSGYAWNANTGWISFNCANDNPPCANSNYGVNIDSAAGNFTGYAWSANIGWISFNRKTCVGGSDNGEYCAANSDCASNDCSLSGPGATGAPPSSPFDSPTSLDYVAKYNFSTHQVEGWAKILSLGDNGWIKFNGVKQSGQPWAPGVSINLSTGEFSGWAWNANSDSSGRGWISFNCANDNSCAASNYKVIGTINRAPTVANMTAPNWSFIEAAQFGARNAKPQWSFSDSDSGSSQSAYQIIVNTNNNINNPLFDSGKCLGAQSCEPAGSCDPNKCLVDNGAAGATSFPLGSAMALNYNQSYYWWVTVWDNNGVASDLTQYNTVPDTDNDDGAVLTFTTYKHEMPVVDFNLFPPNPSKGEEARLTDASRIYQSGAPGTAVPCDPGSCRWLWTATAGADITDPTASSTKIKFNSAGNTTVTLKVTDNDNYFVSVSMVVNINAKLPKWKEVKPE